MEKYLLAESQRSAISLYVPETLAKCEFMIRGVTVPLIRPCESYLKPFLDITRDDKWIGLLIWQHATAADHMKDAEFLKEYSNMKYKCVGCEASGKGREKGEGKPYDGWVYPQTMKNGRKYMELAPGGRYEIHNAGRQDGMSVLWDRSVRGQSAVGNRFSEIIQTVPGIQYVDARVTSRAGKETGQVLGEFLKERRAKNETAKAANAKRNALRSAAEGTQERGVWGNEVSPQAAAKRLAALRAPSQAEQNAATAEAKKLTALRSAKHLISEFDKTRGETHVERAARIATSAAKSAAKSATRRSNAIARRTDPSFLSKVMAADAARAAKRNALRSALRNANASAAVVAQRQNSNAASAQNQGLVRSSSSYGVMNAPPPDYSP